MATEPGREPLAKTRLLTVARHASRRARQSSCGHSLQPLGGGGSGWAAHDVLGLRSGVWVRVVDLRSTPCTMQILTGSVSVRSGRTQVFGWPGDLLFVDVGAQLAAVADDTTLLLTWRL